MVEAGARTLEGAPAVGVIDQAGPDFIRWPSRCGFGLLGLQFAFLIGLSVVVWQRFTLGIDFGIFSQAWTQIGTGHLNPQSTINGFPFLKSHFELLMWPLALLHPIVHSSLILLFIQDATLVATNAVVLVWVTALLRRLALGSAWTVAVTTGVVVLLLINPAVYATTAEDFHFEPVALLFAVLAAYDLWSGRTRRLWLWVGLCLLCGDIGGLYLIGLGLTGVVAAQGNRLRALVLLTVGAAWVGWISALGANAASDVSTGYAYLAGRKTLPKGAVGLAAVLGGLVGHPDRPWNIVWGRWGTLFRYLESGGAVGAFTPWGFGVPLVALGAAALQGDGIFLSLSFQNVVVAPFVTFGSAWLVVWIARRWRNRLAIVLAALIGVVALVAGGAEAVQQIPTAFTVNATAGIVPSDRAAALDQALALTPAGAEVIAAVPTIGRFAERRYLYTLIDQAVGTTTPLPVHGSSVVTVIDSPDAPQLLPPPIARALEHELVAFGGHVLVDSAGVVAVLWHPSPNQRSLSLP